jgi:anti-anti-sigma factor
MTLEEKFPSIPNKPKEQVAVMILGGDITSDPKDEIRRTLGRRMALGYRKFIFDIEGVNPVATATIQALLPVVLAIKKSGHKYCFVSTSPKLAEVLGRTKLEDQFPHFPTQEEAIRSLLGTA